MIKTLSPYWLSIPFVSPLTGLTCTDFTLQVYVWDGDIASPPATVSWEITNKNPTASTGNARVNIANILNDYIQFEPQKGTITGLLDSNNSRWVKWQVVYTTSNPTDATTPSSIKTKLMVKGYNLGLESENKQTPTNGVLMHGREFKVNREGVFTVPIEALGSLNDVTIISYPLNEINKNLSFAGTSESSDLVKYVWINASEATTDEYIEVTFNSQVITLLITDECRYTPIDIFFQNREGAEQVLTFFKTNTESLSVTSEEFQANRGQANLGNHQYVKYNTQGRIKLKVNSGFVSEDLNQTFTELLLSQRVWKYENSIFVPVNVSSKSIEYKTRQKDRLINYEIEFEYAFNAINNI